MRPLKIFGWAKDHHGCGNYRMGLPMWALGRAGHDAVAFSNLDPDLPTDLDVLVGQMTTQEEPTAFWQQQARRSDRSFAMVYEIDDDVWHLHQTNPAFSHFYATAGEQVKQNVAVADLVTVTNDHLAEVMSEFNPNVVVLPNCFDAAVLSHQRPRAEKLTVGWAGGSSHQNDFLAVSKDLRTFFKRNPQVDTHFMGVNHGDAIGRPNTRFSEWQTNLVDYIEAIDFDLGIAPLAYNTFNRSKSDLRFVEYASLGIPVVASDFGPYSAAIIHGVTGMKVKYPHEWAKHLYALASDDAMRAEIGVNARNWATTRTIQANVWRWEEAYYGALGLPARTGPDVAVAEPGTSAPAADAAEPALIG